MICYIPNVGNEHVVRLTRHFGILFRSGGRWNVTHLPTGLSVGSGLSVIAAVALADGLEAQAFDWDFFESPGPSVLRPMELAREAILAAVPA